MTHITQWWAWKKSLVTVSRRHIATYIVANHMSPLRPSSMRPKREYCLVIRASWPSALSNELAQTSSTMPMTLIHITGK